MSSLTTKELENYLSAVKEDVPVKIFCSYNQYNIKRVALYDGELILEVGDAENPIEDQMSPMIA